MLKRSQTFFSSPFMLALIFTIFVLKKGQSQTMQVQIHNTPQFFYSHICQLTFTIISQNFSAFNPKGTQTFMISILQSKKDVLFLNYYVPPYIHTNNSILIIQSIVDTCNRGNITSSFYCISIISSNLSYPQTKIKYNTTHFMYKFTINNIICPSVSLANGQDQYDIKFKIDVPVARDSTVIKMTGNYTYRLVGLKYRIIEDIYINPTSNGTTVYQGNNFLIGGQSKLSFVMDIVNKTQANNWQYFQIFFLQPIKNLSLITNSCLLTQTILNPFQYPLKPYIKQTSTQKPISCSLSILSNSLTFTNTNHTSSSFIANKAFNLYDMYDYNFAGVRLNFSIDVNIYGLVTIQYYYVIRSTASSYINDMGLQVAINPTSVTIYENKQKPNTIYSVPLQTYQTIDSKYKAYFIKFNNDTKNSTDSTDSNIFTMPSITISQFPFIITIFILSCTILMILTRKQLYRCQNYLYIIFVLTDLLLKIILIVIIDTISTNNIHLSNIKQVSYLLTIFVIIQYLGFGIILFITYCTYLCYNYTYLNNKAKNNKQLPRYNIIFILFTMLINYKLYCICLFNINIGKQFKPKRYRNDQLYIKYCWHLVIQIIIILVQIFCICTNCTYLPITISFTVHQGILVILMSIVGKYVYSMLKWNKIKRKVKDICGNAKINKLQQKYKDRQLQEQINNQYISKTSQLNKSMNKQQKASSKLSHTGQPTSRAFITQIQPTKSYDDSN